GAGNNTIGSTLNGTAGANNQIEKGGLGTIGLSGANQFASTLNINEGILRAESSGALSGPSGTVNVQNGATLQISDPNNNNTTHIAIQNKQITITGSGSNLNDYNPNGALEVTANTTATLTGVLVISGLNTDVTGLNASNQGLFPNAPVPVWVAGFVGVDGTSNLTATQTSHTNINVMKVGTGTLTLAGALPDVDAEGNNFLGSWGIKGTLVLNKAPGISSITTGQAGQTRSDVILVGDDISAAGAGTLIDSSPQQIVPLLNTNGTLLLTLQLATNGSAQFNASLEAITTLSMEVGPLGGSKVTIGAGDTLAFGVN